SFKQSSTQRSVDTGRAEGEDDTPALSTSQQQCRMDEEDEDLKETLSKSKKSKLDLVFEEWDVAGLPWWFLGNLRNNYKSRSNGSTDIQTNQDIDTAIVSDTTDDLWFLNESKVDSEVTSEDDRKESGKKVSEVTSSDDLEDSQCLSDDTDIEAASEDCWQCGECKTFNSPVKRYCFQCWALRRNWFSDCPKLAHSLSTSNIATMQSKDIKEGIDVPDCRRTVSAPIVRPKEPYGAEGKSNLDPGSSKDSLDLAQACKVKKPSGKLKQEKEEEQDDDAESLEKSLESSKELLKPCLLCQKRPRDGNIIHGRTCHLVVCFMCARLLKKERSPCPVCKKRIQRVIRIFIA
uniref:MDM4 protein n=1 Tax=Sphenodon punctatus TaxID=8508 RepID=A0A8D0H717_SPHPU